MRMWHKYLTEYLCNKHLIGAHGELHKFRHAFIKKHSIDGRISPIVQIEPWRMGEYHEELVSEMLKRGIKHNSPYTMPDISYLGNKGKVRVDIDENIDTLRLRCKECFNKSNNKRKE